MNADWQETAKMIRTGLTDLRSNIMPYLKNKSNGQNTTRGTAVKCLAHTRSGFFMMLKLLSIILSILVGIVIIDFITSIPKCLFGDVWSTWQLLDGINQIFGVIADI
jgi:hypothetical protein